MREILFRGKRTDNGEWVYGFYFRDIGNFIKELPSSVSTPLHLVHPETIGQYTGLRDKNGKRIFEGDIVIFKTTNYHFEPCVVEYHNDVAQFVVSKNGRSYPMADDFSYEVIGNIHDNPELIGGKEE